MNFMIFVATELREIMASLGIRTVEEMVGRSDLLKKRENMITDRADMVDLSYILDTECAGSQGNHFDSAHLYDFRLKDTPDMKKLLPYFADAISKKTAIKDPISIRVSSTDRAFGTILGSEITKKFAGKKISELKDNMFKVEAYGGGGQSFGAFIPKGLTIKLYGDANDGLGKGLSGGRIIVVPPKEANFEADKNIIIGNVALYGATSGTAYICGVAGERFLVRNSGATAVSEGCGDHGLEYMTGGKAVILGPTGRNFAAGMSGGVAYVLDENHCLYKNINREMVSYIEVSDKYDIAELKELIRDYQKETSSAKAAYILDHFDQMIGDFKKVIPNGYSKMLKLISKYEAQGIEYEAAVQEAFEDMARE
jgi:glutamate synthase (ferredoxin)